MLKNLKRASAIMLSLAMAVQFGMADTYFANTLSEEPIIEETQEQEPVTVEEGSQQVAVEQTEAPAIDAKEEFVQVPETKSVTLSYVAEDGTILRDATTHEYEMGYSLNSDASVMLNFDGYTLKDVVMNDSQIVAAAQANLNVTSDLTSVKFVYQKVMAESHPEANEAQEENKTEEKTEEDAEADPEAKEELPEYPAFDMSATAGNVTVHVTAAEGVLPSGAQLIVKRVTRKAILNAVEETVTEKDKEVDSAIALDITIVNADGIEIQPNGIVNVSFENVAVGGEEVNVYHVTDDASTVTEVATNTQSFDANHFSIYVITGEKKVELTTFNFVANEQNVSTQIVKTGDTLITPTAPDIAGKAFVEWQENGSKFDGFGVQTITKTEARTITAKYENALYVYFYNPGGTQIMRTEKVADHKDHDYSHVSYDVDATHKLVGWAAIQNGTDDITKNIAVPEGSTSVNVYAIIKEGYWVTFDSNGGSAIDSQFVFDKISLNDQTTPTKPGYEFVGWYNGTEKVENDATISSPMTLTAHWKATEVNYTVNYWQQKVTDDKNATDAQKTYEYVSAETKKATTGTKISASNTKSYNGFTYNANNSSKDVEIAGDGTTIINVYYDRVLCTVNFYEVTSRGLTKVKTATGLYEASLPKDTWDTSTYAWYSSYSYGWGYSVAGSGCILLTSFDFKTAGYENNKENKKSNGIVTECNFYGTKARREYEVRYYNQQADGSYKLVQTVNTSGGTLTVHEKFIGYDLYKLVKGNVNGESSGYWDRNGSSVKDGDKYEYNRSGIINIASNLKSYSLSYYNYNKVTKTVSNIKYTTPMNSYENYTPERPSELPSYYVFGGWYKDKACTTKFDFSKETMPNANLQIYAKWSAEQISLTYNLNNPEGTVAKDTKKVEAGTVASTVLPSIPTINEYSFAGWYYADGNGNITSEVFNTNNTITKDTTVVGKWLYKGELTVVYNPGTEKDATVPTDDKVYAGGARVTVAGNATTTSDMKFLGWKLNGNVYKPGQSFEVNKDIANKDNQIILTATWGNAETSTILTYDPGNGIGKVKTVNVMNNEAVKIKAHNSLGFTAPVEAGKEYYFAGWADSKTGNATYTDGQTINIDANGENVLYAVWVEKTEITLVANSGTRTYNGAEQSIDGFESTTMNGYTVSGLTAVTKGTNVGEYTNTVFGGTAKVEKDGVDVTDKVVVKTRAGKLVITPKSINTQEITVTKPADSKYDGNEHKNLPTVKDGEKVLVKDTDYTLSYSEDVINAGTVTVTIKGKGNYSQETTVDYQITPRTVKLTSGSDSKTYDGTPLTKHEVKEDGFVKDDGATYEFTGSQTNVGTSDNTFDYALKDGTFASNYIITTEAGKLTVNPVTDKVTVTIKEHSAEHVYDGTEKTVTGYDVKLISNKHYTKDDFTFTGTAEVKGTNVGEYPMNVQASDFTNNSHNFTNVTFIIEDGSLKITPKSIVPSETNGMEVTGPADTKYNGDEQKLTPVVKDQGKVLTENVDYKLSYIGDTTNVGTVKITIKGKGNYNGSTEVSYKITKRSVTLTSATDSKVYDKDPLTNHNVTIGGDGFVKEEGATYNVTGSQTSVGESDNEFTYTLKSNTKAENYNITTHNGKLIVTAEASEVTVVITGRNGTFPYDGTEKSVKGYDVSITQGSTYTEADFTFSGNDEVKGTEANTYPMGLKVSDFTNNNTNYSSVTFVVNDGSLVINPKSIIPDGPDTPDEKKTGIEVTDPEGSIYDGLPHVNPLTVTDTKTGKELEENKDYTLTYVGDVVNVGTVKVKVKGIGNYTGEFTKKYQITPREYTVTTDSAEKPYDGTALTAGGRVNNLVDGETVTLKITGSQTEVGSSNNTYSLTWDGSATVSNYTHGTDSIGLLTVTPKSINTQEITVTKPADSKYDGNEHKNKPTVKDGEKVLVEDTDYTLSYSEDVINAGTVTVTIKGKGNYSQKTTVDYQITPRTVNLTSGSDSKTYDGTPLVKHDVTVSEDGFADGEGATYSYTGTQTDAGSSENTFTYALKEGMLASNYEITTVNGTLTVEAVKTEVKVEIAGHTDTVTYDGQVHSVSGYDVTNISNKLYSDTAISFTGTAVVSRIVAGTSYMGLTAAQFSNTSANFTNVTFVVHDGWLKVDPKSIIPDGPDTPDEKKTGIEVTKPADSKYDGNVHENKPEVKDTKTGATLVEGTDYTLSYKGDTTNAGTVTVKITGVGNYTGSHNVEYQITKRNVTLTSATASKVYDKTPLTNSNITIGGDGFAKLEGASYNVTGSQTNVGDSDNEFTYKLNDDTKASNYNIEVKFGKLYITTQDGQVIVVITGHKKTYDYDGTEKTVDGYDVSITEGSTYAETDFTFNGNAEVKATEANTYPMGLKASDFTNNNTNYSSVTFVVTDGSLVIKPKSIIPDGPDTPDEKKTGIEVTDPDDSIYDGLPHVNPLTVTDTKTGATLVKDADYTLSYSKDVINVGTVDVTVNGIGNYTGEFKKSYKITPREYTVTTDSAKKVYDGTALTAGGKIEGIVDGEVVVVHTTGSQTEVGSTPNTYKLEWKKASSKNYKLKEDSIGTLTVTEQTIDPGKDPDNPNPNYSGVTINNPSNSVYDGKEHKWSPAVTDKEGNALVEGTDYEVAYSTSDFTNVTGTITVTITGIGNYTGTVTRTYEITPKAYTVTTESAKKVYDGTALTAGGKIEGIVSGETVEFTTTGSRTDEGTSKNTYSLKWNGSAIQTNYKLAKESIGDLTVTPKSIIPDEPDTPDDKKTGITVSNPKDSKYDGQEHREVLTVKDTKTGKDLIANKDYTVVYSDDLVNAGTVTIKVSGLGNYSGSFTKTYKITKRLVTLTSATVSKTYDGQALTNTSITVSGDGFVEGEGASYEVTGTQTSVGNSANAFEYKLNEKTLASNYDITKVVGTLTITAAPAPVTPPTSPTPVSPPPVTPRYIQQVVPAPTPQEEVKKEKTPKAEPKEEKVEKVEKEKTPKARPEKFWALINLICAIVTVLFGLLLLISKRHKNKDDEDDETKDQTTTNEDEEKEQEKKRGAFTRVLAVLIAILSVVFFLVTEDMSLRWTWTDQWTIWMVVIGLVQIVVFFVGRKWKNVDDDEDEQAQQA
ncbi:InlB B-repeat-containing protein [Holdemanella porci]|uniref:InlB B-repeat-containing protein n=1 Tax=Holdemanella porci TaxID=2652276 RepID=UPI001D132D00|nr:InlB B-repeat-containing protein [Holdemanella porci]MCC3361560.1 InlB B-repeat-containing protein [Holdemanella porci]